MAGLQGWQLVIIILLILGLFIPCFFRTTLREDERCQSPTVHLQRKRDVNRRVINKMTKHLRIQCQAL